MAFKRMRRKAAHEPRGPLYLVEGDVAPCPDRNLMEVGEGGVLTPRGTAYPPTRIDFSKLGRPPDMDEGSEEGAPSRGEGHEGPSDGAQGTGGRGKREQEFPSSYYGAKCKWYEGVMRFSAGLLGGGDAVVVKQWRTPRHGTKVMVFRPQEGAKQAEYEVLEREEAKRVVALGGAAEDQRRINRLFNSLWNSRGPGSKRCLQHPT